MNATFSRLVVTLAIALLSYSASARAQAADGEIQGVVVDLAGTTLQAVTITVVNVETGATRVVRTDANGRFAAPGLAVGRYEATAACAGFAPRRQENVAVSVGETLGIRFELRPAADPETLTVGDLPPAIDPTGAQVGTLIEEPAVRHLPIRTRSVVTLAGTAAGVTRDLVSGEMLIAGQAGAANTVSVDGAELPAFGAYLFSPEAIQEFRVDVSGYRAEYGRASGGVIHAVTKSGTNAFHGSARALTGGSFFSQDDTENLQAGAALGGPIARDRHFFFANVDALRADAADFDRRAILARTDHQITGSGRVMLRYGQQAPSGGGTSRSSVAAVTTILGSRFVNDGRVHYAQSRELFEVNRLQVADTVTWVGGAHQIKTGFDAVGDDPSTAMRFGTLATTTFSSDNVSAFAQDEWQASRAVTVNLGARHDVGAFDQWDPRIGVAWLPAGRLVTRASYGRFSSPFTGLRVRQATGGVDWEWMPQTTLSASYLEGRTAAWDYHAVTGEIQRRFRQGTQYRAAYTFADAASRHRVVASYVYGTDVFSDRFDGVVKTILKDWTLSAMFAVQSRDPALDSSQVGHASLDPRIARNFSLGSAATLAVVLETYNLRDRMNVRAVENALFPPQVGEREGRLTQAGVRLLF
jgi:hypothetical protein